MGKYSCEKCAKSFSQKSHYDKHISRKNPCEIQTDKIKALIDKAVDEKLIELNKKLKLNNTESNITINITEQMDISKMSKINLLEKCKELGITKCSSKNKPQLIELINSKNKTSNNTEEYKNILISEDVIIIQGKELKQAELVESKKDTPNDTIFSLFEECLQKVSIKEVAVKLNLCVGTIRRWIELKDVPIQYTFDLYKILSKEIDYSKYTSSLKDQFFTPKDLAKKCWEIFNREVKIDTQEYTFIEPSAGDGSFLHILPKGSIGLDIEPRSTGIQKQDYLTWKPTNTSKKHIAFGNPPFGLRGHLALNFINHSYSFADYVCFILPQLFESDGKGSPRKRVNGYNLIYSEGLSAIFYSPDNKEVKVNGVFQIWSKNTSNQKYIIKSNSQENIKVYSLSDGGTIASTRNKDMIDKCDIYLPSTCFGKYNMKIYKKFEDLPGKKGYGVIFFTEKADMINKAETIDWTSISFLSTNSAYNLRTSIILDQFI
jgi:hypothetical protein